MIDSSFSREKTKQNRQTYERRLEFIIAHTMTMEMPTTVSLLFCSNGRIGPSAAGPREAMLRRAAARGATRAVGTARSAAAVLRAVFMTAPGGCRYG